MSWLRLWHDMPTDPKWRTIARKSGQPLPCVIALFNLLMINASENTDERGTLSSWSDEDAAAALDMDEEAVAAIIAAMDGKVIENGRLTGWDKRQPKREDGTAAQRKAAWQERENAKRNALERNGTQRNAPEADTDTDTETEVLPTSTQLVAARCAGALAPQPDPATSQAKAAVVKAYHAASALPPDTSRIGMWVQQGFTSDEIVSCISAVLARGTVPTTLKYFDKPLAEIRTAPRAPPMRAAPPLRGSAAILDALNRITDHAADHQPVLERAPVRLSLG